MLATWLVLSFYRSSVDILDLLPSALAGLDAGLILVLIRSLRGGSIGTNTMPNYGMLRSAQITLMLIVIAAAIWSIIAKTIMSIPIITGVIAGIILGVFSPAGVACIQHFLLRFILYRHGDIPWNYARFLDSATQLIFLQKVGGGYIFIHRMLLEHFAKV